MQYHHNDHQSVRLTTDANGAVLGSQGHYPFGEAWYSTGTTTPFAFTSYYRDGSTGMDYAVNRFYGSRFGRFHTNDPLELLSTCSRPSVSYRPSLAATGRPQEGNLFSYVANNPPNSVDPLGLFESIDWLPGFGPGEPGFSGDGFGFAPDTYTFEDLFSGVGAFGSASYLSNLFSVTGQNPFDPCTWCLRFCDAGYSAAKATCVLARVFVAVAQWLPWVPVDPTNTDNDEATEECLVRAYSAAIHCVKDCEGRGGSCNNPPRD